MRILYAVHKYDYGRPEQGLCYEHHNFYRSLVDMGHDVAYFDFPTIAQRLGRKAMNQRLLDTVRAYQPDLMFTVVWGDLLEPDTIREISHNTNTTTLNWYCDDHWQFESLSKHWTPCFNWVVTTDHQTLARYQQLGYQNVIKSQWACNPQIYQNLDLPHRYDVTFVGLPHGIRRAAIQALRDAGIDVRVWGAGWPAGRLTQLQMIRVFNQSRININFSQASTNGQPTSRLSRWAHRYLEKPCHKLPGGWRLAAAGRALAAKCGGSKNTPSLPTQIKGRNFEVPSCGGFLLTGHADQLSDYYRPDQEIAVFDNTHELIEKIRYYLAHEDQRAAIAHAGYQRTQHEHTYAHRFQEIFQRIGLAPVSHAQPAHHTAIAA